MAHMGTYAIQTWSQWEEMAGNMVCFLVCQSKEGVEIYRDALKGGPIFLSNSRAGPGRWWIPVLCRVAECYPPSSTLGHWPRKKIRFLSASSLPPSLRCSENECHSVSSPPIKSCSCIVESLSQSVDPGSVIFKLRSGCDMLGEFWAHIAYFWLAWVGRNNQFVKTKFTRLIAEIEDHSRL